MYLCRQKIIKMDLTFADKNLMKCASDKRKPHEDPIPEDENHKYIWAEILGVEIIEIVNYHKEK